MSPDNSDAAVPRTRWSFHLTTQNPFYLISAACFIHSLSFAVGGGGGSLGPGPRFALIVGYLGLVATTAGVLVRRWRLWDDARSLLLILLLLFVELDLGIDELLVRRFSLGVAAALAVLAIVAGVSETVFRVLPLRFPAAYRLPYYLLWGLLILFPIVCAAVEQHGSERALRWTIAAFLPVGSLLLLTLLPAARFGPRGLYPARHPWPWPLYPWSAFAFVALALVFRQYSLCVSFDPAESLSYRQAMSGASIFAPWMLAPLIVAVAALVHERALATDWRGGRLFAAAFAFASPPLTLLAPARGTLAADFLSDVTRTIGSPAWLALLGCIGFQLTAWLRGNRYAPGLLGAALCCSLVIGPETNSFRTLATPGPLWLAACVVICGVLAVRTNSAGWAIAAGSCGLALAWNLGLWQWYDDWSLRIAASLLAAYLLAASFLLRGNEAEILRACGFVVLFLLGVATILAGDSSARSLGYVAWLAGLAATFGFLAGEREGYIIAVVLAAYVGVRSAWLGYAALADWIRWPGLHWLSAAIVLFAAGLAISRHKARTESTPPTG